MIELENLENKVNQAIRLIEKLHVENDELKKQNENLMVENQQKEQQIATLKKEIQNFKEQNNFSGIYAEKEKKIRTKIQQILQKLENFKKLNNECH